MIAVDFDGVLATYEKGQFPKIGKPIRPMIARVHKWLNEGEEVAIFTARVSSNNKEREKQYHAISRWLLKQGLGHLPITSDKSWKFHAFYDDRAFRVEANTGKIMHADEIPTDRELQELGITASPEQQQVIKSQKDGNQKMAPLEKQYGGNHYKHFAIQPIEFVHANKIPAIEASVIKYVTRHQFKNGAEDIRKAIHCLEMLLELEYKEQP